uniref:integrase core domain-containing protein n=1 Tax=Aureimonas glaciei TaxID=1776957 RepID=UPI00166F39EA
YLIALSATGSTALGEARPLFERAFAEHGLPEVIRSDNGTPFAAAGPTGLTQLSAWWIKLGIRHERIDPGVPQQNGRHERCHLTLLEAMRPPAADRAEQQQRFDAFQADYNSERPHQALGQKPPASLYRAGGRVAGPLLRRAARHHRSDPPKTPPRHTTKTPSRRRAGPFQSRRSVTHPSGQFCYSSIRWTGSGMRGGAAGGVGE